jgi:prepilin-type N-terminal cleavage/methylation domain-containing protein
MRGGLRKGFTLIELLVVIAIIGVLSSVVLASLNTARAKARDAQRASSIQQVQLALELYYDDNGSYVYSPDVVLGTALTSPLTPDYIAAIPTDPGSDAPYRYYANLSPATFYAIYIPYERKAACYVCGGSVCAPGVGWWGVNMC